MAHTGGDTVLLDGETAPNPLRGVGTEDVFNMSFGVHPVQNDWIGGPLVRKWGPPAQGRETVPGQSAEVALTEDLVSGNRVAMYRIFGPDPICFATSAILRFGTKQNPMEAVTYAYLGAKPAPRILAPQGWLAAGPFLCTDDADFEQREWAEDDPSCWPAEHEADFGSFVCNLLDMPPGPTRFAMPARLGYERGWCDFIHVFRGRQRTNRGAQPAQVSAYARGSLHLPHAGKFRLHLGFDDAIKVWIDNRLVYSGRHERGFAETAVALELPAGEVAVLVKLSNGENGQWRLWAFAPRFTPVSHAG